MIGAASGEPLIYAAGFYAASGGIIALILSATAGAIDYFTVVPPASSAQQRGALHGILNTLVWLALLFVVMHRGGAEFTPDKISILVSLLPVAVLGYSAWLGGTLSYRNQVGVDRRSANAGKLKERSLDSWERPICNQNELSAGQIILARIADQRIAVAKCSEGMVAFSDHCTHKGGPLSDGALIDCTVQCPWHGSQFDVRTGRVVSGPAENKIDIYSIEIRNNEVYIKPRRSQKDRPRKAA